MSGFQPRAVAVLARRTLVGALDAPAAAAAVVVFYALTGYLFLMPLFLEGQASIRPLLDFAPLLLALLAPALTMGLLAEELRAGTFETLACCPLEDWDIALGKYLGFAALLGLLIAGLVLYPAVLAALAAPPGLDWGEAAGVLSALLLSGLLFGAIGLFASSLTRSQAAAFLIALGCCLALLLCGRLALLLPPGAAGAAEYVGLDSHLEALGKGVLTARDLCYFASATTAFLFLAVQRLEARRS